jgi:hypothetical protein
MELDWVKNNLPCLVKAKRALVEVNHPHVSIAQTQGGIAVTMFISGG